MDKTKILSGKTSNPRSEQRDYKIGKILTT